MDSLPDHLIIEILSRLNDSIELAHCKCVSKTLNALARQVRSIHLYCSLDRYTKMRSPETSSKVTPFMKIFDKLISEAEVPIESVSLGVDELVDGPDCDYESEEEKYDLFLTAGPFSDNWMSKIGDGLKSILIEDFWSQSCGRQTDILEVISYHCHSLVELTVMNASLTADDMHVMPLLTRLTLKSVSTYDKNLDKLMECLPCLQILNLINSCGDTNTKIYHLDPKELKLMLLFCPEALEISSVTVYAPNLTKLELECHDPVTLSIHAPLLSYFHLNLESAHELLSYFHLNRAHKLNVVKFMNLKTLNLVSSELYFILFTLPSSRTVQNLTLYSPKCGPLNKRYKFNLLDVFTIFPNVTSLTLGAEVWSQQMVYPSASKAKGLRARIKLKVLKQITVYLVLEDIDRSLSFILYVAEICRNLSDIVMFIHCDVDLSVAINFVSSCMSQCSKVRWRWGTWKEEHFYLE